MLAVLNSLVKRYRYYTRGWSAAKLHTPWSREQTEISSRCFREHVETLIVGGGQAGLTMSHMLSQRGCPHLVLERGRIAERWRSERWDGLRFQFPNWSVSFPIFLSATPTPTASPPAPKSSTTSTPMQVS